MTVTIALAGNPNSGKTTLFNELTGMRQHVGNYPGITVEKKEGKLTVDKTKFNVVDLPGTYSLTAYSMEEIVARDFVVNEKPAVVVDVVDASNLERNLYLAVQFMELGSPLCIALNMIDTAGGRGIEVDHEKLSQLMGIPIHPMIARTGKGVKEFKTSLKELGETGLKSKPLHIKYGHDIDNVLHEMEAEITDAGFLTDKYPARWIALKYLENDEQVRSLGEKTNSEVSVRLDAICKRVTEHLKATLETYPEAVISDHRYGYIKSILKQGVISTKYDQNRLQVSDKIDMFLVNRFAGPIIMFAIVYFLYHFTFTYSAIPVGWFEGFFGWLGDTADSVLPEGLMKSLIISGIIDGVGGVLGFVPLIIFMFFGIAFLEDTGYLARVAYMLDRVFRAFGLHGSSVMAYIISGGIAGGCAVPGVMAARTLRSPRERLATILTAPFMNCGAKLPVFALLIAAFFDNNEAWMMFLITLISWVGALLTAKLLRGTVIKGESTPFVMELPPYRLPTFKGLLIHTWERTWMYIRKAGTVIVAISIIIWALMTFPMLPQDAYQDFEIHRDSITDAAPSEIIMELESADEETELSEEATMLQDALLSVDYEEAQAGLKYSMAGRIGIGLESVSKYAGFDWRTNIALVGGFAAKEVVVSSLGTAYSLGGIDPEEYEGLSDTLANSEQWNPAVAFSLILFTIFYAPCFVTVVAIAKEAGSWKWAWFSIIFNTLLAYILAVIAFQIGTVLGFGG